jgi:hypothetical protein
MLLKMIRSEQFVKSYCLNIFQQRQKVFLQEFKSHYKIYGSENSNKKQAMIEVLQDYLWSKSQDLDRNISNKVFNLDLILDIAHIVWLIYFIEKNNDVS